jgi:ribosomal protein S12 methylthiotransferase
MLGQLAASGFDIQMEIGEYVDLVILNTCGFLTEARAEGTEHIEMLLELKRRGRIGRLFVTGCMVRFLGRELIDRFPEVDAWLGVFVEERIITAAARFFPLDLSEVGIQRKEVGKKGDEPVIDLAEPPTEVLQPPVQQRLLLTPPHLAYLRIADGCSRHCTFCTIPQIRGRFRSRPAESIVEEAHALAEAGVVELVVIAQETTFWGTDLPGTPELADLLEPLEAVPGIEWIRIMYAYPGRFSDRLIERIAGSRKIVPYLDMPLQHCSEPVLKRMNRRMTPEAMASLLGKLRERIPGLVLRTSLIAGFPGETEEQFRELVDFVERWHFERLGVFGFSPEPNTAAARLSDPLPDEVVAARAAELFEVQRELAFRWSAAQVGRSMEVLLDVPLEEEEGVYLGRTYADAPDVDPVVYVTGEHLATGRRARCEIVGSQEYDLIAVPVES